MGSVLGPGACGRQPLDISLPHQGFSLSLPFSIKAMKKCPPVRIKNKSLYFLACKTVCISLSQDSTGSFVLPFRQVMYAPYPSTHIDVDVNTVKQMPPCHEHIYNQRRYMRSELTAFWRATSEEDMAQDSFIYTDENFTPDL